MMHNKKGASAQEDSMNLEQVLLGSLPVWKSVQLGGYKSADDYSKALAAGSSPKRDWIDELVSNPAFACADQPLQLDLVAPSVGELGFAEGAFDSKLRTRALQLGLQPCPIEVLAALQLNSQDTGERVIIATDVIPNAKGDLVGFDVTFGQGGLRLNGDCGPIDRLREADTRVAFVRPKS
jgi:hypothetical protein